MEEFKARSTKVRTNVNHLRKLLQDYSARAGKDDPIIIALPAPERSSRRKKHYKVVKRPPGEAYRPEFTYNPRSQVAKQFAVANYLLRGGPSQIGMSLWRLAEIFSLEPKHPDVLLGFAEALGSQLLLGLYAGDRKGRFIAEALALTRNLDPATADP